jgi:hypothetical protein
VCHGLETYLQLLYNSLDIAAVAVTDMCCCGCVLLWKCAVVVDYLWLQYCGGRACGGHATGHESATVANCKT